MFSNIFIVVFFAFFQLALSNEDFVRAFLEPNVRCLDKAGIKRADFDKFVQNPTLVDLSGGNRSCYILCLGIERNTVNEDGKINLTAAYKDLAGKPYESIYRGLLNKCAEQEGATPCNVMKNTIDCFVKEMLGTLVPCKAGTP